MRVRIAGGFVQNSYASAGWVCSEGVGTGEIGLHRIGRVAAAIGRDGDFVLVVVDAKSPAEHKLAVILTWATMRIQPPGPQFDFLRRCRGPTHAYVQIRQWVRTRPEPQYVQVVLLGVANAPK